MWISQNKNMIWLYRWNYFELTRLPDKSRSTEWDLAHWCFLLNFFILFVEETTGTCYMLDFHFSILKANAHGFVFLSFDLELCLWWSYTISTTLDFWFMGFCSHGYFDLRPPHKKKRNSVLNPWMNPKLFCMCGGVSLKTYHVRDFIMSYLPLCCRFQSFYFIGFSQMPAILCGLMEN